VKVLYVAGWGRSGSTILGRILGQIQGFFLVGELRYIWDRGLIENRLCSCGAPFMKCPLWQEVVSRTLGNDDHIAVEELVDLRERELHTRHLLLTPTLTALQARLARMEKYAGAVEQLYHAVQHVSGARVIVDTSKFPSYGYVLQNLPSIELYVLHLVRDPRAVAYSWNSRRKLKLDEDGSKKLMTSHGFGKSSLVWDEWNLAIENLRRQEPERQMLLRYEDFVASPRRSTKRILRFLGDASSPRRTSHVLRKPRPIQRRQHSCYARRGLEAQPELRSTADGCGSYVARLGPVRVPTSATAQQVTSRSWVRAGSDTES
jgi:hypothetical protein